jgi:hypothetical protein
MHGLHNIKLSPTEITEEQLDDTILKYNLSPCSSDFSDKLAVPKLFNKFL